MFGYFLDVNLVFNGLLCHYILLLILVEKASFRREKFDIIMRLKYRMSIGVEFEQDKVIRLRRLYLGDRTNMNEFELDKDYLNL